MQELKPLTKNLKKVVQFQGKYEVQLEIPFSSTLTDKEIERILVMSSWKEDPNKLADGWSGLRAAIIKRDKPIRKNEFNLEALLISGIGHLPIPRINKKGMGLFLSGKKALPPSKHNYMNFMKDDALMGTEHFRNGVEVVNRPKFRALGTYTQPELMKKLYNTLFVSSLPLIQIAVPHVEAYGRYLNSGLKNETGNFGFMVFPIPKQEKRRIFLDARDKIGDFYKENPEDVFNKFIMMASKCLNKTVRGLRELHEHGIAHLQLHPDNYYMIKGVPYVMDWGSAERLSQSQEDNIKNRALDIVKCVGLYYSGLKPFVQADADEFKAGEFASLHRALIKYCYKKLSTEEAIKDYEDRIYRSKGSEFDMAVQFLEEHEVGKSNIPSLALSFLHDLKRDYDRDSIDALFFGKSKFIMPS